MRGLVEGSVKMSATTGSGDLERLVLSRAGFSFRPLVFNFHVFNLLHPHVASVRGDGEGHDSRFFAIAVVSLLPALAAIEGDAARESYRQHQLTSFTQTFSYEVV